MYFAFLSFYMRSLVPPALLGVFAFFYLSTFSHLYSAALLIWSVVFIEWWRIKERKLSVKWGVKGAANVEMLRAEYVPAGDAWWKQELKMVASVPVITAYAILLITLLTSIFAFEAFITQLYNGPGHQYIVSSQSNSTLQYSVTSLRLGFCSNRPVRHPCPPPACLLSCARSEAH